MSYVSTPKFLTPTTGSGKVLKGWILYSERLNKVAIARSETTSQSREIASIRPEHHAVQGFVHNDRTRMSTYLWRSLYYNDWPLIRVDKQNANHLWSSRKNLLPQ
jgi:hypothetical protein